MSADQDAPVDPSHDDDLSFTAASGGIWVEKARTPHSQIVALREPGRVLVNDAREPMLSDDGQSLAFVRDDHGRGRLMVRQAFLSNAATETALAPASLDVYEASFRSADEYAFSALERGHPPRIYLTDKTHTNAPLALGESRYPALSPDGAWMAYSHLDNGVWNLWLRNQRSGATRRIADIPCNQMQPAWEEDSKTVLYGTDCGRSLWFTAIARRRVLP
jgi:Tol biopolymer transport system component